MYCENCKAYLNKVEREININKCFICNPVKDINQLMKYIKYRSKNLPEIMARDILNERGYHVIKRGYPDLFYFNDKNELCGVEVKPTHKRVLKIQQYIIGSLLTRNGIKIYRYDNDTKKFRLIK